ncbi:MAG: DNA repair protein RadC [Bacteroidales bacterium]|nr:DNA repair protein RadC [Bacteroidales bacterium]
MDTTHTPTKLTISEWSSQDRPREKYLTKGASSLSDAELIAILLRTGTSSENAVALAKRLLSTCHNSLATLSDMPLQELLKIKGIGEAKAIALLAAFELDRRVRSESVRQEQHIHNANDVVSIMQDKIAHLKHEEFWVIYLSQSNKIIATQQIGKGGITSTTVDVRIIIQNALLNSATGIVVCHNHPSGSVRPSKDDRFLTKQIQDASKILNINLLDHIIIHKECYFSFHEEGIL